MLTNKTQLKVFDADTSLFCPIIWIGSFPNQSFLMTNIQFMLAGFFIHAPEVYQRSLMSILTSFSWH